MNEHHVVLEINGHTAFVTLRRPPVNALNRALVAELTQLAIRLKADPDVWCVVVTAEGKVFCAGADLKERMGIPESEVLTVVKGIQGVTQAWSELPQPVIMGVNGAALGGGLEFALAGDIIVAGDTAVLGLPEVGLGIIPAAGGTQRIAQRASMGVAKKWVLTARQFTATEAKQDGVIDFLVPSASFDRELSSIVESVAGNAPIALRQAKRAIETYYQDWLHEGLEHELLLYDHLIKTSDRVEALKAFTEKRKPQWTGM